MSWNSGSQLTITVWRAKPEPSRIDSTLAAMFPCVISTPLGSEVEPEVYCRKAVMPGVMVGRHAGSPLGASRSVDRHSRFEASTSDRLALIAGSQSLQVRIRA